ncbi:MAG: FkbM family methyltransferase [Moraxellaceae bacterium]|nr:MAG: FkbM family methyltransferase [Moraxellaceae bacterium]
MPEIHAGIGCDLSKRDAMGKRVSSMKLPWVFARLLSFLLSNYQKSRLPGKYWFFEKTKDRFGRFLIEHRVATGRFWVPWDQWCFWLEFGPENYYLDEFIPFSEKINELVGEVDFVDLGADIGAVSLLVAGRCHNIRQIIAVEPNPNAYQILNKNLQSMALKTQSFQCAVSNFSGWATLAYEEKLGSDHEGFITMDNRGVIKVQSLDGLIDAADIELAENVVIKIDVEGQEGSTIEGAKSVISTAMNVILLLEIHPDVLKRDGISAEVLFEKAEEIREFKWLLPAQGNKEINRASPFFDQADLKQYDVIGVSIANQ